MCNQEVVGSTSIIGSIKINVLFENVGHFLLSVTLLVQFSLKF